MATTQRVSRFMLEPTDILPATTEKNVNSWDTVGQSTSNNRDTHQQVGHCGTTRQQQQRLTSTAGTLWDSPTATIETNGNHPALSHYSVAGNHPVILHYSVAGNHLVILHYSVAGNHPVILHYSVAGNHPVILHYSVAGNHPVIPYYRTAGNHPAMPDYSVADRLISSSFVK